PPRRAGRRRRPLPRETASTAPGESSGSTAGHPPPAAAGRNTCPRRRRTAPATSAGTISHARPPGSTTAPIGRSCALLLSLQQAAQLVGHHRQNLFSGL